MKRFKYIIAVLAAAAVIWGFSAATNDDFRLGKNIEILANLFREVCLYYVDPVDADQMLNDTADALLESLDPYTEFIPDSGMSEFEFLTTGKYGGIGAVIRQKGEWVVITEPYRGYPADRAGIRIGDRIVAINGEDAEGLTSERASSMLKGDPGTALTLTVESFYTGEIVEHTLKRERIAISGVPYHGYVADGIGYIEHSDFTENCSDDLLRAILDLKRSGELQGLVLDYRGNAGGILQEAVKILSYFLPRGSEVVEMRGRVPQMSATFRTEGIPVEPDIPIAVLTNGGTASAAEIVSGALQDLDRAVIIGQRTFGKGLVQTPRHLGYNNYLKMTTAKYYIPSGRCIQAIDYARRSEEGSVSYVPDSLIREFKTASGRPVFDGGGITPDLATDPEYINPFVAALWQSAYIEDFCDIYARAHPERVEPLSFHIDDATWSDFTEFMADKDTGYRSETAAALSQLRTRAAREEYIEAITPQIEAIERGIKSDTGSNIERNKQHIRELIEANIVLRSNYAEGVTLYNLQYDRDIREAVAILQQRERYNSILHP